MSLTEGQMVTYAVDEVIETVSNLTPLAMAVNKYTPEAASMQRSSNTVWMPVEQESPTQQGWDLTGQSTDLLELSVKCNLGEPDNDFFGVRADEVRDERTWRRRIAAAAKKLASNVEIAIASQAAEMGSLVVTNAAEISQENADGWNFVAEAEEIMFARELNRDSGLTYAFNPHDYRQAGYDLANRDIFGRIPEAAYRDGDIQRQVAGFDNVIRSPKLQTLTAGTPTGVTVDGAQSFKPEAFTTDADGNKENVDNRTAVVAVSSGTGFKRGDKISFTGVKFLSQMAKNVLTQDATFSVIAVNGNNLTITPKPIALNDTTLTAAQRAYANINVGLADNMAINILNVNTVTTNVFLADDAIRLISQPIPAEKEMFAGMRVNSFSIPGVGINGIIAFQGDINTLTAKCRIALWYAACAVRPEAIGVGLSRQTAP